MYQTAVPLYLRIVEEGKVVGDPGIEPGVRLREGVTVPCHTLRPVAHVHPVHCTGCEGVITSGQYRRQGENRREMQGILPCDER